jgi:hypothetical protein
MVVDDVLLEVEKKTPLGVVLLVDLEMLLERGGDPVC